MAESLASSTTNTASEVLIPHGRVENVCRKWLVHEDETFAYRLQNEEIHHHYAGNRNKSQLVRSDIRKAKTLQEDEENEAAIMQLNTEMFQQEQAEVDEKIAQEMQEQMMDEVNRGLQRQRELIERDENLAKQLYLKDKQKVQKKRLMKELTEVEKIRNMQQVSSSNNLVEPVAASIGEIAISDAHRGLSDFDLSEFCMKPSEDLTEEEKYLFQIEQDAELASFLQKHDLYQTEIVNKQKLIQIESKDRELAMILQQQEKERNKKLRLRAKQKAIEKQRQSELNGSAVGNQNEYQICDDNYSTLSCSTTYSLENEAMSTKKCNYHNVAIDLDPTYKHEKTEEANGIHYAQVYKVSSSPSTSTSSSATSPTSTFIRSNNDKFEFENSMSPVPPYMPVQGQRRISNSEKGKSKIKERCKTQ